MGLLAAGLLVLVLAAGIGALVIGGPIVLLLLTVLCFLFRWGEQEFGLLPMLVGVAGCIAAWLAYELFDHLKRRAQLREYMRQLEEQARREAEERRRAREAALAMAWYRRGLAEWRLALREEKPAE